MNNKQQIMELLGITEMEYSTLLFEQGICFLEKRGGSYAQQFSYTKKFWQHWQYQYALQDDFFIAETSPYKHWSKLVLLDHYKELHKSAFIVGHSAGNSCDKFYAEVAGACIKEINQSKLALK